MAANKKRTLALKGKKSLQRMNDDNFIAEKLI